MVGSSPRITERQPTIPEAVDWILQSITREYRIQCLHFWREKYGDEYADQVEKRVRAVWGKRK